MGYNPTEYPHKGEGKYYYITYESLDKVRGGKKRWKPHVNRVFISGTLLKEKKGTVNKRNGRTVHGVKLTYMNTRQPYHRKAFKSERDGTRYKVSSAQVGRSKMEVEKVVELPKDARNIKVTDKKSKVEPTLIDVY